MAEMAEAKQTVGINFAMVDPEGTAPIRVTAGHCRRVGEAWLSLGQAMEDLAGSFDVLTANPADSRPEGRPDHPGLPSENGDKANG